MPRSPRRSSRSPRRSKSASFRRRPTKRIPRRGSKGARNSRRVAGTRRYRGKKRSRTEMEAAQSLLALNRPVVQASPVASTLESLQVKTSHEVAEALRQTSSRHPVRLSEDVLNRVERLKEEITGADRTNDSGSGSIGGRTMERTQGDSSTLGLDNFTAPPPSSFTPGTNESVNTTERVRNHKGDANQQYWNKVVDMFMALVKRGVSKDIINTFKTDLPTEIMKKINDSIDELNDKMAPPPLLRRR